MSTTIHLIRHGETEAVRQKRFVGSTDMPLSSVGQEQAAKLSGFIKHCQPSKVIASPMLRARETARLAMAESTAEIEIEVDEDLREIDFGRWEGLTFDEIVALNPDRIQDWSACADSFAFPEGEHLIDYYARIRKVAQLLGENAAKTTVVFAHGGVIRTLICYLTGIPHAHQLAFEISPASVSTIRINDGIGVLAAVNDQSFSR